VPFLERHWKTSLVFVVESVFEIHCSTEGSEGSVCVRYRDEVVIEKKMLNTIIAHSESMQLIMRLVKQIFTPLKLFRLAITKRLNTY
jgi:hypothetical protein